MIALANVSSQYDKNQKRDVEVVHAFYVKLLNRLNNAFHNNLKNKCCDK